MKSLKGILWKEGINGLGVSLCGMPPIPLPYCERFDLAARSHDADYDKGCDGKDRKKADYDFLVGMVEDCDNVLQVMFAVFYFIMVRLFGSLFFKHC